MRVLCENPVLAAPVALAQRAKAKYQQPVASPVAYSASNSALIGPASAPVDPLHIPPARRNLPISTAPHSVFSMDYSTLLESAQSNDAIAESELADRSLSGRGVKGNYAAGLSYARQAAAQGNARGEFLVGLCMENGWATPRDENQALEWWQKASDQGYPDAEYFLGQHFMGEGVGSSAADQIIYIQLFTMHHEMKESAKGRALRDAAAKGGYAPAEFGAGNAAIRDGNFDEAISLLQSSAAQGNAGAYITLGDFFCRPPRMKRRGSDSFSADPERGFADYQKAAQFGFGGGEEKVANAYLTGCGVPKDSAQAASWYKKAASAYLLRNFPVDAFFALKKAAQLNDPQAEEELGTLYERGVGVKANQKKANELYAKASAQGYENAEADVIALNQQITQGQDITAELDAEAKAAQPAAPVEAVAPKQRGSGRGGWIAIAGIGAAGLASSYGADAVTSAKVGVTAAALTAKATNADPNNPATAMLTGASEAATGQMTNPIQQTTDQEQAQILAAGAANNAARSQAAAQAAAQQAALANAQETQTTQQATVQQVPAGQAVNSSSSAGVSNASSSSCGSFPSFVTASSSAFTQFQSAGLTQYAGSLTFNLPPGFWSDGAEIDNMAQGTSFAVNSGTAIPISDTVAGQANSSAFIIVDNGTDQMNYTATFPTNVPNPFSVTLKPDGVCGPHPAAGGAGVPD